MGRKLTDEQVDKLCKSLYGSADFIDNVLEFYGWGVTENDLTYEDHLAIDNVVFNCTCCGWWFGAGEWTEKETDELICESCGEDEY